MLSSILNSSRAAKVNIAIMRTFVKVREMLATNEELLRKLNEMEKSLQRHSSGIKKHNRQIKLIFEAIRALMTPPKKIGFQRN